MALENYSGPGLEELMRDLEVAATVKSTIRRIKETSKNLVRLLTQTNWANRPAPPALPDAFRARNYDVRPALGDVYRN